MIDPQYVAAQKAEEEFKQKLAAEQIAANGDDDKHAEPEDDDDEDGHDDEEEDEEEDGEDDEDEDEDDEDMNDVDDNESMSSSSSSDPSSSSSSAGIGFSLRLAALGLPAQRRFQDIINNPTLQHHPIHSLEGIMPVQYLDTKVHKLKVLRLNLTFIPIVFCWPVSFF